MKIRLLKGKQKELILLAKGKLTWGEFSNKINIKSSYLCNDLKNERVLISREIYNKISKIANINFDNFIIEKLNNNWGKSKGGKISKGSLKDIKIPDKDEKLSEFIGILLGDGNITKIRFYKKNKKRGVYQIKIAGDYYKDKDYHLNYIKPLCEDLFGIKAKEIRIKKHGERFICLSSRKLVEFLEEMELKSGNKIKNKVTIPRWVFENKKCLTTCVRGLIDTDGSIFRMSNRDYNLIRIIFTNHNIRLLNDTRGAFIKLGFNPSKIINKRNFYLSRKLEIEKYLKEIGFSNMKHKERFKRFKKSPIR